MLSDLQAHMKKWRSYVWMFLAQLAGFIVGGIGGCLLAGLGLSLAHGGHLGDQEGLYLLIVGPLGFLIGGLVGMGLAGKWIKAASHQDAEGRNGGTPQ